MAPTWPLDNCQQSWCDGATCSNVSSKQDSAIHKHEPTCSIHFHRPTWRIPWTILPLPNTCYIFASLLGVDSQRHGLCAAKPSREACLRAPAPKCQVESRDGTNPLAEICRVPPPPAPPTPTTTAGCTPDNCFPCLDVTPSGPSHQRGVNIVPALGSSFFSAQINLRSTRVGFNLMSTGFLFLTASENSGPAPYSQISRTRMHSPNL